MELLTVETTLPTIKANFDAVKQQLVNGLKTYNVLITADTVKDGKTMASEINKIKKAIKEQEKIALEKILGPSTEFKEKIKELMALADEARDKITAQVSAYEEKTKLEIKGKLGAFMEEEILKAELRAPFSDLSILDLVKLGSVTKTGNLTSVTINAIKGRVAEQKNLQLEEDARIAQEKKDEEDRIAAIREEERIKAEANIKVHVTVDPPQEQQQQPQQTTQEQYNQMGNEGEINFHNPGEDITPTPMVMPSKRYEHNYQPEPMYEQPQNQQQHTHEHIDEPYNEQTGEFENMQSNQPQAGRVSITAVFDVDISTIPNITDEQLVNAIQNRLKAADVKNSTIVAINRY